MQNHVLHSATAMPWASTTGLDILQWSLFYHYSEGKRCHVSQKHSRSITGLA